ncbi:MAG: hypothetical protein O3A84_05655, partial [Proteobacteria bacterium]|nr:hypothetical protein [Pseudomonadota bacterium]
GNQSYGRNIFLVFLAVGLWHGAGWTFVAWGLFHAALVIGYHLTARWWDGMPKLIQIGLTFALVSIGWILFVFDFQNAQIFLLSLLGQGAGTASPVLIEGWIVLGISAFVCFGINVEQIIDSGEQSHLRSMVNTGGMVILLLGVFMFIDRSKDFIYFRF